MGRSPPAHELQNHPRPSLYVNHGHAGFNTFQVGVQHQRVLVGEIRIFVLGPIVIIVVAIALNIDTDVCLLY